MSEFIQRGINKTYVFIKVKINYSGYNFEDIELNINFSIHASIYMYLFVAFFHLFAKKKYV